MLASGLVSSGRLTGDGSMSRPCGERPGNDSMHCRRDGDERNGALRSGSCDGRCESGVEESAKLLAPLEGSVLAPVELPDSGALGTRWADPLHSPETNGELGMFDNPAFDISRP